MSENGFKKLMAEANAVIETISVVEAIKLLGNEDVCFIDIREKHEREGGYIEGSFHAARGFLEFMAAPDGPMHKDIFASGKRLVLYCGTGGRSALAAKTLTDLGIRNVINMAGGYAAWKEAS